MRLYFSQVCAYSVPALADAVPHGVDSRVTAEIKSAGADVAPRCPDPHVFEKWSERMI
jgi:hypothetical protein